MGLIIDNFAGGGGASVALEAALGRKVDVAINHDPDAIAMHTANHPDTRHYTEDVFHVNPSEICRGQSIDVAWFSPDCKHFSRAKGGAPVSKKIRGLAWVVLRWAQECGPSKEPYYVMLRKALLTALADRGYVIEQGWKPIETAPRDDTEILIAVNLGEAVTGLWGYAVARYGWHDESGHWWQPDGNPATLPDFWRPIEPPTKGTPHE